MPLIHTTHDVNGDLHDADMHNDRIDALEAVINGGMDHDNLTYPRAEFSELFKSDTNTPGWGVVAATQAIMRPFFWTPVALTVKTVSGVLGEQAEAGFVSGSVTMALYYHTTPTVTSGTLIASKAFALTGASVFITHTGWTIANATIPANSWVGGVWTNPAAGVWDTDWKYNEMNISARFASLHVS